MTKVCVRCHFEKRAKLTEHKGKRIFEAIDNCSKPTIALINGTCYGGSFASP